jgi:hypothetical protein
MRSSAGRIEETSAKRLRRSAERRAIRDLSGRILCSSPLDKLPPDGSIHRAGPQHRKGAQGMPLTDAQIANVIFNETRSLSGADIQRVRVNIAHTIINADNGSHARPRTGSTAASVPPAERATYAQCLQAVQLAREERGRECRPDQWRPEFAPKGTKRLLGVVPPEDEIMPSHLKNAVGLDRDVFAEMEVCPMSESKRGHMQFVCVESA